MLCRASGSSTLAALTPRTNDYACCGLHSRTAEGLQAVMDAPCGLVVWQNAGAWAERVLMHAQN